MSAPRYIYVHGFNSSPQSYKARQLKSWMEAAGAGDRLLVPALDYEPARAMEVLRALVQQNDEPTVLIGSSLGGYYSTWLVEHYDHLRAVLVNPSVRPFELLARWLGDNENIYTHERYLLTREHLAQLKAIHCDELRDPRRYLLLVQTGDETLDYREAVEKYAACRQIVQPGGSHGFDHFERVWPELFRFAGDERLAGLCGGNCED